MNFEKKFVFLSFNRNLIEQITCGEVILGFDPSYIAKSGKHTPGLGFYYTGWAGKYKKGLEIGVIAAIDMKQNTAYHVESIQSPVARKDKTSDGKTLVDHYASCITNRAGQLLEINDKRYIGRTSRQVIERLYEHAIKNGKTKSIEELKGFARVTGVHFNGIDKLKTSRGLEQILIEFHRETDDLLNAINSIGKTTAKQKKYYKEAVEEARDWLINNDPSMFYQLELKITEMLQIL